MQHYNPYRELDESARTQGVHSHKVLTAAAVVFGALAVGAGLLLVQFIIIWAGAE